MTRAVEQHKRHERIRGAQKICLGVVVVGRPTFDVGSGGRAARAVVDLLDHVPGVRVVGGADVLLDDGDVSRAIRDLASSQLHAVVVVFATFADNRVSQWIDDDIGVPVVLWSLPEERRGGRLALNSLCGAQMSAFELRRRHRRFESVHVSPFDRDASEQAVAALTAALSESAVEPERFAGDAPATARAARLADDIAGSVVGCIGSPPPGFTPCEADDAVIEAVTGVRIERIGIDDLFDVADDVDDQILERARNELRTAGSLDPDVPSLEVERSLRLRAALAQLTEERGWQAVAVRCWPECLDVYGAAICAPLALTAASGVPAVGEADALGAVTALVLQRAAGFEPFLTDLIDADAVDDTSAIWHCGCAPPSWAATPVEIAGHPLKGTGLANQFALAAGRVTVARLGRSDESTLVWWTATARLIDRPRPFTGTSGVLEWPISADEVRRRLLCSGVEHHLVVVPGEHEPLLAELATTWGIGHHRIAAVD